MNTFQLRQKIERQLDRLSPEKLALLSNFLDAIQSVENLNLSSKIWADYDEEADVLYVSFRKPQRANDSILEDNVIYHYRDKELVGITVLRAKATNITAEAIASN